MSEATMTPESVQLAAPGAGLPLPELWIARLRFRFLRWKRSREELDSVFEAERARVLELARSVSPEDGARQILIRRLRGLEDSSRNWSVFMTLDHLRIVNLAVLGLVRALAQGEQPSGKVSTADVKPSAELDAEIIGGFDRSCEILAKAFAKFGDLSTPVRHPHPWFGPLDAAGWHALSAMHTRIHRAQIESVLTHLKGAS